LQLSVIIVNYNVCHFLEQCLFSLQKAARGTDTEIIVIDNHSSDNSIEYLQPNFPQVRFISNEANLGFAKACNLGLRHATGEHILFLNPDTILPEDCLTGCIKFFKEHPDCGALGVRMVDGTGRFLKESKRAFPSAITSLFKLLGLARLFPRSKVFARYYLGHLDQHEVHEVDVLAGAFFMTKKEVLEKTGSFDEKFFMYGEDVDLSFRIRQVPCQVTGGNYKNYYFPGTTIIHFKGESTRRGSLNYVRLFYRAMSIFVRKHYSGASAGVYHVLIQSGIWLSAFFTALSIFIRRIGLPLIDAGLMILSFWIIKRFWSGTVRPDTEYQTRLLWIAFPSYTILFLITAFYAGLYDKLYTRIQLIRPFLIAFLVLLAGYSLLPEKYRFSRGIILFGSALAFVMISFLRWVLTGFRVIKNKNGESDRETLIVADPSGYSQCIRLMEKAGYHEKVLGRVGVQPNDTGAIGSVNDLQRLSAMVPYRELVFCEGETLSFSEIIALLGKPLGRKSFRIHASGSESVVGSDSRSRSGEIISTQNGYNIAQPYNRRLKRLIDTSFAAWGLLLFPLHIFLIKKPLRFFSSCFSVLAAKNTWVGYALDEKNLPALRSPILACNGYPAATNKSLPAESLQKFDYWYARDYEPLTDLKLLFLHYRNLGS
jgi:O-antigen biosynthesis protein